MEEVGNLLPNLRCRLCMHLLAGYNMNIMIQLQNLPSDIMQDNTAYSKVNEMAHHGHFMTSVFAASQDEIHAHALISHNPCCKPQPCNSHVCPNHATAMSVKAMTTGKTLKT